MMRGYRHVLEEVTIDDRPALVKRERQGSRRVDLRTWEEAAILRAIADQGIPAPAALGFDADGSLLMQRLPGIAVETVWPRGTLMPTGAIADLAATLARLALVPPARLPSLPAGRPAGDDAAGFFALLISHTVGLLHTYQPEHEARLRAVEVDDRALSAVERAGAHIRRRTLRLCHGDLKRSNLLRHDGRIWVVDWELATLGDPAWDVAVLIHRSGLQARDASALQARLRSIHPDPPADDDVSAYLALEQLRSLLVDAVRYRELGMKSTATERERLARRLTAKLREARPHRTWALGDVMALLFDD
jgi:aminoglycoside phosphotransferase (APT) family kinase protein